mgnify:CR=1 FL=1
MKERTHHGRRQLERTGESLDISLDDHPTIIRIRMQLPPWPQQVSKSYSFFIALLVLIRFDVLLNYKSAASYDDHLLFLFIDIFCQIAVVHFGTS